ncbi:type II toxin-antitoxin system VapC family toxin [Actinocrinis puniceicyclus]|uniref:Type II toxin-antitoxin system VapC family toxin n=1 Tax=Actinocrinis puniceicyclus TaxID=977794 RepID=A0A8J8B9A8_9ACTN|nr:type II toxin-antitoxin system VapC family toxin [Actinocrinis puniceicyclus]MBS2961642.1 type II toxin-antitoxin system VapC family toxin [Actinocrinis puniceicyclus]
MTEPGRLRAGLLDTCVIIDFRKIPDEVLPVSAGVSTVTLAELSAGVHLAKDGLERSARITRLISAEANFEPLPFDSVTARAYGNLVALILAIGRNPKPRKNDLMIAATAVVHGLPLYTRNVDDFKGLESQLNIVAV